ncbi:MAG: Group II intron-encoded protein LtrA [Candidatus Ordinivivax streblomastigis]|uniref:RNA-directed DNA polymerase n=1 Tax=Candidatus Ordinivivax streblomastigis TaxID=2540710 RepID=A0A5M8P4Y6_9BACT|nr:MAG: Group II intron-encoded protein LtrA [Candidatus Ordinivivax streblomastigis]KAA6303367.1 MAG: Group II intron-encoded protein LtrA [Candidatus Ordinivivax streblomastigis]
MKGRKQKISKDTCPQKDRSALESYAGGQTFLWMTESEDTREPVERNMLEYILSPANLNSAYKQVVRNQGVGGIDKMEVSELKEYLQGHKAQLLESVLNGSYQPQAVKRVEIPKRDGGKRKLGIPTVIDRLIQQSIHQVLTPLYEKQFSDNSYGFRPKRSAHQALKKVQSIVDSGYIYAVDMDLEKYFDTVNQSKLIEVLSRTISDGRVISLIHKYLRSGVEAGRKFESTEKGTPQGSPLSPLLGNIMLHELDKELASRGHAFVRYADDMMILCQSKRSAERTLKHIVPYIENKLFLRVNKVKTEVAHVSKLKFLGYGFYKYKGKCRLRVHPKSMSRMKERLREITSRSNGKGDAWRKETSNTYIIGWVNYYKLADMKSALERIDEWYRRRLRMVIWKQWKRIKIKLSNLIKLGVKKPKAWEYANTRKGYWHTANSPILSTSISNERLKRAGYIFFTDYYIKVAPVN